MKHVKSVFAQFYSPRVVWLVMVVALLTFTLSGMAQESGSCGIIAC